MTERTAEAKAPPDRTGLFSPAPVRRQRHSHLNDRAWRLALLAVAAPILAQVLHRLLGGGNPLAVWLVAGVLGFGWIAAVRFLLLDSLARIFWIVWLAAAGILLLLFGRDPIGRSLAYVLTTGFLLLRFYAPYWHMTSVRRAKIFGLGLLSLIAIFCGWRFGDLAELSGPAALGLNVALYFAVVLGGFWIFSLLHLFLRMRLHFMRLKPKLAVSALFLAFVPLVLVVVLGLVAVYGALGGSRALRGRDILQDWAHLVDTGTELGNYPLAVSFRCEHDGVRTEVAGDRPEWLDPFLKTLQDAKVRGAAVAETALAPPAGAALPDSAAVREQNSPRVFLGDESADARSSVWSAADTTAFFRFGPEVWLLRLRGFRSDRLRLDGFQVDRLAMDHLSDLLHAGAGLYMSESLALSDDSWQADLSDSDAGSGDLLDVVGRFRSEADADSTSLWGKQMSFGASVVEVIRPTADGFQRHDVLLHLKVSLADLFGEFARGENEFNQAVLLGLAVLALLFLLVQVVALFLGVRITTGITSAVKQLRRGTMRLARGDLNTRIEIPNEDEFGDLALSFNEMTAAIQRGQQQTIARERLERELATAREIQERLLPHDMPVVPGFEVAGTSVPSRQVGGDYFDFLMLDDSRLGIAIGDVSGKGMPAALLMANLQASLQGQVIHPSSVAEVVERVNDLLARSTDPHMFVTFFYGVLDRQTGVFSVTNAGHNPPLLLHVDGTIERLHTGGLLLGMLAGQRYQQQDVRLEPGEVVVLYTDGITEAIGPAAAGSEPGIDDEQDEPDAGGHEVGEDGDSGAEGAADAGADNEGLEEVSRMFGEDALERVLRENADRTAAGIKEAILAAVARHTAGTPQSDDITLVIVKRQSRSERADTD